MSGWPKAPYSGPTGATSVAIPSPLVFGTIYQNTTTKAMYLSATVTCTVSTTSDVATATLSIGATSGGVSEAQVVGVLSESEVFGGSFRFSVHQVIPPGWFFELTKNVAGSGTVNGFSAFAWT